MYFNKKTDVNTNINYFTAYVYNNKPEHATFPWWRTCKQVSAVCTLKNMLFKVYPKWIFSSDSAAKDRWSKTETKVFYVLQESCHWVGQRVVWSR